MAGDDGVIGRTLLVSTEAPLVRVGPTDKSNCHGG